ncbi:MAG: hypothetical protein GY789_01775 [Hyphomicrobiales bacterium]|nr:hypothetical protein [Hyphomicrobiales bacterium]
MTVYALGGRRPDPEGAKQARFPIGNRKLVADRIRQVFLRHNAMTLVASAACGADLVALDVAGQLNIDRHVVLPFAPDQFKNTSVLDRPGDWGAIYEQIIGQVVADGRLIVLDLKVGSDDTYRQANDCIINTTTSLGNEKNPPRICLVWEGAPRSPGDISYQLAESGRVLGWPIDEVLTV